MDFTPEQSKAIEIHDRNLIVVAGAGSGKTRVLVERFLALLEANRDWPLSALVAITFTKKAAQEMRDRVRQSLEARLVDPARSHETAHWSAMLSQIDSARIDTIHGLCASILRANAAQVSIDPEFAILDEIESAILLEDVVEGVLAKLVTDDAEELRLIAEYGPDRVRTALQSPALLDQPIPDELPDLMALWQKQWSKMVEETVANLLALDEALAISEIIPPDGDKLTENVVVAAGALGTLETSSEPDTISQALANLSGISWHIGSKNNWNSPEELQEARDALRELKGRAKDALETIGGPPDETDEMAAQVLPMWLSLVRQTQTAFREAKRKLAVLDFDDLERMTCELLSNNAEVRARYRGTEFKHLLVDEFQDTNARQWQIVKALAALEQPGSMFVVGDQKQSIYAFRGADVSVFGDVREEITRAGGEPVFMARSFRTHAPLVDAFNDIFSRLLVRDEMSPVAPYQVELDSPMSAERQQPPSDAPPIEMIFVGKYEHDRDGNVISVDEVRGGGLNTESRRIWEAEAIAARIQQMVADGYVVEDEGEARKVEYGDFALLFQSLSQVAIYEDALARADIPYVTVAGRGYFSRQEVWDLLNLLRAVHNPSDNLAVASVLRSPMFGLSDNALFALRLRTTSDEQTGRMYPVRLWDALLEPGEVFPEEESGILEFAREQLFVLHAMAGRITIFELLTDAIERTGFLATLSALPEGNRMRANVEKLLAKAQESGNVTLSTFTQYLGDLSDREAREGEAAVAVGDSVQLMTVHKSKGLEFPVVILPDASWKIPAGGRDLLVFDNQAGWACQVIDPESSDLVKPFAFKRVRALENGRDAAERLRLLYVAATRARDYLIVTGQAAPGKEGEWKASGWLDQLLHVLDIRAEILPGKSRVLDFAWGSLRVTNPLARPELAHPGALEDGPMNWDVSLDGVSPQRPPLLEDIVIEPAQRVKHLAATNVIHMGQVEYADSDQKRRRHIEEFRRRILYDAPEHVREYRIERTMPSARQIGEIVHEALRFQQLPSKMERERLKAILKNYAWRQSITEPMACTRAADRAYQLLGQVEASPVQTWIEEADEVYRELPFVLEFQGYVIHGVIDLLLRRADGRWVIVDYKTGKIPSDWHSIVKYAQQYHLQVGLYAQAVEAQLKGETPEVYIHFVQYASEPVRVDEREWRGALEVHLDQRISEILKDNTND